RQHGETPLVVRTLGDPRRHGRNGHGLARRGLGRLGESGLPGGGEQPGGKQDRGATEKPDVLSHGALYAPRPVSGKGAEWSRPDRISWFLAWATQALRSHWRPACPGLPSPVRAARPSGFLPLPTSRGLRSTKPRTPSAWLLTCWRRRSPMHPAIRCWLGMRRA